MFSGSLDGLRFGAGERSTGCCLRLDWVRVRVSSWSSTNGGDGLVPVVKEGVRIGEGNLDGTGGRVTE